MLKYGQCSYKYHYMKSLILSLCAVVTCYCTVARAESFTLEIMHVNDMHSYLEASPLIIKTQAGALHVKIGGASALASIVAERRAKNPHLLVVSAGDQITGNAANYYLFHGRADATVYDVLGTNVYTLGNHEFDHGNKQLAEYLAYMQNTKSKPHLVISNVQTSDQDPIKPYMEHTYTLPVQSSTSQTIKNVQFLGITDARKIVQSSHPDPDTKILDGVQIVNELTARSKADINVLVTHEGLQRDLTNVALLEDIDIIIGGDSHTLCGDFAQQWVHTDCSYPLTLTNAQGKKVCVVQAFEYGKAIGDLIVDFNEAGEVLACRGQPYIPIYADTASLTVNKEVSVASAKTILDHAIASNPALVYAKPNVQMEQALAPFISQIKANYNQPLATLNENLCATRLPNRFCQLKNQTVYHGSEVCQVVASISLAMHKADFYLANAGGFRIDLPAGTITKQDLARLMPFNNNMIVVSVTGAQIQELLTNLLQYVASAPEYNSGEMPCGSNIQVFYNNEQANKPVVSKILIANEQGEYMPLVADKTYQMLTYDYLLVATPYKPYMTNYQRLYVKDAAVVESYLLAKHTFPPLQADTMVLQPSVQKETQP